MIKQFAKKVKRITKPIIGKEYLKKRMALEGIILMLCFVGFKTRRIGMIMLSLMLFSMAMPMLVRDGAEAFNMMADAVIDEDGRVE